MKNLPEDELFNFVENRLRNYSELPHEEGWNKIAAAVASGSEFSKWTVWTNRTAATLSLVVLFLLFYRDDLSNGEATKALSSNLAGEKKNAIAQSSGALKVDATGSAFGGRDNRAKKTAPINSSNEQKSERHGGVNIVSPHLDPVDAQKEMEAGSIINDTEEKNGIDETRKPDNVIIEQNALKKDSSASIEHVLPPARQRRKSRTSFYSMISPSLSFHHVTPDSEDGVVVDKVNSPGVISQERFGFTIEAGVQGRISERLQYIAGLSFYQQSQQISYEENSHGSIIESGDDLSYNITPVTTTRTFNYDMRNVGIQAGILYTLKQRGLMHKAGVVVQYQMGLMKAEDGDVYDNSSSHYFNYQLLYRVEYTFKSGVGLFIQPAYTRSIIANETLEAPFKLKQSRAGLGAGIVYRF